jgi:hypothetical protein
MVGSAAAGLQTEKKTQSTQKDAKAQKKIRCSRSSFRHGAPAFSGFFSFLRFAAGRRAMLRPRVYCRAMVDLSGLRSHVLRSRRAHLLASDKE